MYKKHKTKFSFSRLEISFLVFRLPLVGRTVFLDFSPFLAKTIYLQNQNAFLLYIIFLGQRIINEFWCIKSI
jgi:hypothetical protein